MEISPEYIERLKERLQKRQGVAEVMKSETDQLLLTILQWMEAAAISKTPVDKQVLLQMEARLRNVMQRVDIMYHCLSASVRDEANG